MLIEIDFWELLTINKSTIFQKVDNSSLLDSNGNFKKPKMGLPNYKLTIDNNLKLSHGGFGKVFIYRDDKNFKFVLKWSKIGSNNLSFDEYDINFLLNNLNLILDKIKEDKKHFYIFTPQILKILYSETDVFMISKFYKPSVILTSPDVKKINIDFNNIISLIYIISCKLDFLQDKLKFNHNDLKIDNTVYYSNGNYIDFFLIDFGASRIEINNVVKYGNIDTSTIGVQDKLVKSKDLYCLIHSILMELKAYYNPMFILFKKFVKINLKLNINEDLIIYKKYKDLSEVDKNIYFNKYQNKVSDFDNIYDNNVYFISYVLKEYDDSFSPNNIINLLLENNNNIINRETIELGQKYLNFKSKIQINNGENEDLIFTDEEMMDIDSYNNKKKYFIKYN